MPLRRICTCDKERKRERERERDRESNKIEDRESLFNSGPESEVVDSIWNKANCMPQLICLPSWLLLQIFEIRHKNGEHKQAQNPLVFSNKTFFEIAMS